MDKQLLFSTWGDLDTNCIWQNGKYEIDDWEQAFFENPNKISRASRRNVACKGCRKSRQFYPAQNSKFEIYRQDVVVKSGLLEWHGKTILLFDPVTSYVNFAKKNPDLACKLRHSHYCGGKAMLVGPKFENWPEEYELPLRTLLKKMHEKNVVLPCPKLEHFGWINGECRLRYGAPVAWDYDSNTRIITEIHLPGAEIPENFTCMTWPAAQALCLESDIEKFTFAELMRQYKTRHA